MASKRQQQKADTARRIFAAALTLFREQGYAATTIEAITQAAGVAKGTFFAHFPSKEAVLDHIGQLQMGRIHAAIAADPQFPARDARGQIQLIVATLAAGLSSQPLEMRALTVEILARRSLFDIDRQGIGELDALMAQVIAAGQAAGQLRADAPAARMATLARTAYFLALFEWVVDEAVDLVALSASYLDLIMDGLAAR